MRRLLIMLAALGLVAGVAWLGLRSADSERDAPEVLGGRRALRPLRADRSERARQVRRDDVPPASPALRAAMPDPTGPVGRENDDPSSDARGVPLPRDPEAGSDAIEPEPVAEPAREPAPEYPEGPRYRVLWGQAGLCDIEGLEDVASTRAAIHATFVKTFVNGADVFHDPIVPASILETVGYAISDAQSVSRALLGFSPAPPAIYIYADLDQLRSAACVNQASVAYYDGDLHVTGDFTHDDQLHQIHESVVHEYMHHTLLTWGIGEPQWLQEGLALYAAQETWWQDPSLGLVEWLRNEHLPFELMTKAFPHTADELFAGAAYYQSYRMVHFVAWLHGEAALARLAADIARGATTPEAAFTTATGMRGSELETHWSRYLATQ